MDIYETNTHSFIVKIWCEDGEAGQPTWRGQITHVSDGQRRYLKDLAALSDFIVPYMEKMGIKPEPDRRAK